MFPKAKEIDVNVQKICLVFLDLLRFSDTSSSELENFLGEEDFQHVDTHNLKTEYFRIKNLDPALVENFTLKTLTNF